MSNQRTQTSGNANRHAVVAVLLPCLLIGQFLWNVLTPAHESQMRSAQVMTMTVEALMLVGLFGLRASMPKPLFWITLVAGLGLFALRLTGDDGWWTGHLVYTLPSR
jgi:cyanate permease